MSGCAVCIGGGDYSESYAFQNWKIVKARKQHVCYECNRPIEIGHEYHYFSGKFDGEIESYKTCLDCHNIRAGLTCDGGAWPAFGNLWDEIICNFPHLKSTACLTKIKTPSAKAYFLERWRKWKGLE